MGENSNQLSVHKKEKTHSLLIYLSISLSAMDTEGLCKADIAASAFLQQKSVLFE